jgi:anti-anti-sigma factor
MSPDQEDAGLLCAAHLGTAASLSLKGSPPFAAGLRIEGSLGNEAGLDLLRDVEGIIRRCPGLLELELDLTGLNYASSTAVGALASIYVETTARRIELRILDPGAQVMMVLEVLGFASFLPIVRKAGGRGA